MQKLEWKPLAQWPTYSVSTYGDVRNDATGVILLHQATGPKRKQYPAVALRTERGFRMFKVHLLMLETFRGPRPAGLQGMHLDDDVRNTALDNLQWGTPSENMRMTIDRSCSNQKLHSGRRAEVRQRRAAGESGASIARDLGISQQRVCDIFKGRYAK